MSKYAVEFSHRASVQIRNIFTYIAEENASAALKMVDRLEEKAHQLADMPHIGAELPEKECPFLQPGYRKLTVRPFILYNRVIDQTVFITHIIHSKRNQANALAEKE